MKSETTIFTNFLMFLLYLLALESPEITFSCFVMYPTHVTIGKHVIPVAIRISPRARRISIRISAAKDKVAMTLPKRTALESGLRFLHTKADWIMTHIQADYTIRLADGVTISVLGKDYTIHNAQGRGITHLDEENNRLMVYGAPEFTERRVKDFLEKLLLETCVHKSAAMAGKIDRKISRVRVMEAGSRWGSCTSKAVLSFNRLLIFAPLVVLDYIIAHEVAHLKEMNHSTRFWQVTENLYPAVDTARQWLRRYGHSLHCYQ